VIKFKILVTGASGRVGRHLVNALLTKGEQVKALVMDRTKIKERKNLEILQGNLLDKSSLKEAVRDVDTIYHLAACVDYLAPKKLMFAVNVEGTKNLLDVATGKKTIYLSSTAVMGKKIKIPADEQSKCKPDNYYGLTKLLAEQAALKAGAIVIRSVDVFGPGFEEGYNLVISGLKGGNLPIIGSGKNLIQYIHIDDLIQALLLARKKGKAGEVYLVAGPDAKTLEECWEILCKYLCVNPPRKHIPILFAKMLAYISIIKAKVGGKRPELIPEYIDKIAANRVFSIAKARKELGYKPKISYEQGIKEMIKGYKSYYGKKRKK